MERPLRFFGMTWSGNLFRPSLSPVPRFRVFYDGLRAQVIADSVLASHSEGRWVEIPDETAINNDMPLSPICYIEPCPLQLQGILNPDGSHA